MMLYIHRGALSVCYGGIQIYTHRKGTEVCKNFQNTVCETRRVCCVSVLVIG